MQYFILRLAAVIAGSGAFLSVAGSASAQVFSYSFLGQNGNQASQAVAVQPANTTFSNLVRGAGLAVDQNGTADSFKGIGFVPNGTLAQAITANDYIGFTVTPTAGNAFSLTNFVFEARRLGQGPGSIVFRSSIDNYITNITTVQAITANSTPYTLAVTGVINQTAPVEFRLYGFNAGNNGASGGLILDNSFGGTVVLVPESSTALSLGIGGLVGLMGIGVRRLHSRRKQAAKA